MKQAVVWTIAGSDPSGGAGIQADLKTFHSLNVHGCSILTAVTAQNPQDVQQITYLSPDMLKAQLHLLHKSLPAVCIKIGMLGKVEIIDALRQYLSNYTGSVILDPLLVSSSGKKLYEEDDSVYLGKLRTLFPFVDILTPNLPEAETLLSRRLKTDKEIEKAAYDLLSLGVSSVLIKGGHAQGEWSQDYWTNGVEAFWLSLPRIENRNCRGTGCVYSSAIAAAIALGYEVKDALVLAKMYVNRGIRLAEEIDTPTFFSHLTEFPGTPQDLPCLSRKSLGKVSQVFKQEKYQQLGLYPIIDSIEWLQRLLPLKLNAIQLRIKHKTGNELEKEIAKSIALAKQYSVQLIINDYWKLAIQHGADGVHLGQEDLAQADISAIYDAGLDLGISTHCYYEVARAHAYSPSYIAFGPIYETTSKAMAFQAQGISGLIKWRSMLDYPLIAIGGLNEKNIHQVLAQQVNGIALISAITRARDPIEAAKNLLNAIEKSNGTAKPQ